MGRGKRIIGIVLIIVSIVALVSWEKWGKHKFLYEEIAVFTDDVPKGTLITSDMFTLVTWPKDDSNAFKADDISKMTGKISKQFVKSKNPVYLEYFEDNQLITSVNSDRFILSISKDWIDSCPSDIERLDKVYCYSNGILVATLVVCSGLTEEGFNVIASSKEIETISRLVYGGNKIIVSYERG